MGRTVMIAGSEDVLAMFGSPKTFYRGRWRNVRITGVSEDEDVPIEVRRSLVGLTIPTIFTKERIEEQIGTELPIPNKSILAYSPDVISALESAGKGEEARQLRDLCPSSLDMYVIEDGIYEPAA